MTRLVPVPQDHRVKAVQVGPRPLVILPESRHQSEADGALLLRELSQAPVRELEVKGEPVLLVQFPLQLRVDLLSVGKGDQDKGGATPSTSRANFRSSFSVISQASFQRDVGSGRYM